MCEPTFTVTQIARYFRKTRSAVHVWINKGELRAREEEGRKVIPLSALRDFAKERKYDISGLVNREDDSGGLAPYTAATQSVVIT
jgi:hypothetical protein